MEVLEGIIKQKTSKKYQCDLCHYFTSRKSNMNNHLNTAKHQKEINGTQKLLNGTQKLLNGTQNEICLSKIYNCKNCNKKYNTHAGLWKHKQNCIKDIENTCSKIIETDPNNNELIHSLATDKDVIMMLIKENSELKNMMIKMMETVTLNNINNNHSNNNNNTNSHNKTFNLQFFLNETCKDAMNISEFIENIKIDVSDLENMGRVGYVEGMSSILIKNLNVLDVTRRPIHCTDKKREIMYIKDNNIWEKDDEERNKLHKTIKRVSHKNIKILPAYREKYPGCEFAASRFSDNYNKMIIEVMGGPGDNDLEKEDKIIQKVAKYITINKGREDD